MSGKRASKAHRPAYVIKAAETRPQRVVPGPPSKPGAPTASDTSLVRELQELLRQSKAASG